jgi:tetratricopeptide (TPR) repeat protein
VKPPLCFVFMPHSGKPDARGLRINFDTVYRDLLEPAIREAELDPVRAEEGLAEGKKRQAMYEQLILCEYAVTDLTAADANLFYALGGRLAARPGTTVLIFSERSRPRFHIASHQPLTYALNREGLPRNGVSFRAALAMRLKEAREAPPDMPIYQFLEDYPDVARTKTDVFREKVCYSPDRKAQLAAARKKGIEALRAIEAELGKIKDTESGVVIDLLLSYRAVQAWKEMTELVKKMSRPLASTVMVREQLALALNRLGEAGQAEEIVKELIERRGPSSETCSILGRVYKDLWDEALKKKELLVAKSLLEKAIEAYLAGFEADWRDAYPGINTVTLMELRDPPDPRRERLLPVIVYSVERRIAKGKADYWDYATLIELGVLGKNQQQAITSLNVAVTLVRESWEPATTARNLRLIREARKLRNDEVHWADEIELKLLERSNAQ